MNFGMLHLARPDAAHRGGASRPAAGGRYAFTVWAAPEQAVGFGMALRAIEKFGNAQVPLPDGPPFFRFSDAAERAPDARADRLHGRRACGSCRWSGALSSPDAVFEALSRGGVRTAAVLRAQTPDALAAIRDAVRREVEPYASDGGFAVPMPAVLASGRKPIATRRLRARCRIGVVGDPLSAGCTRSAL